MTSTVLCLRPAADFARLDALPPSSLTVSYHAPDDPSLPQLMRTAGALVIPADLDFLVGIFAYGWLWPAWASLTRRWW